MAFAACAVNVVPSVRDDETADAGTSKSDAGRIDAGSDDAGVEDAGSDDAGTADGGEDAGSHPLVPDSWGTPVPITAVNTAANEGHTSMTADMLRLCFTSNRTGGKSGSDDIWCSFRDSVEEPFGVPVNQSNLNTSSGDWMPGLSADGSEMYFASDRLTQYKMNIYHAEWIPQAGSYGNVTRVSELNAASNVWSGSPNTTPDGLTMFLESDRSGAYGAIDLWVATRPSIYESWGEVFNLNALNSGYNDMDPGPSADGQTLVFSSRRPDDSATRLWRSKKNTQGIWSTPALAVIENSSSFASMASPRILSDGSLLFAAGTKEGGPSDLYIAPPKW